VRLSAILLGSRIAHVAGHEKSHSQWPVRFSGARMGQGFGSRSFIGFKPVYINIQHIFILIDSNLHYYINFCSKKFDKMPPKD